MMLQVFGCFLVILNAVNVISALSKCYAVNDQQYCFYTNGSVLSWDEAREFCGRRQSTLPIITDKYIQNVFQQFISNINNVDVSGSQDVNNYVWLDAHASHVDHSVKWHWINRPPSALNDYVVNYQSYNWCASIQLKQWYYYYRQLYRQEPAIHKRLWHEELPYVCQYHSVTQTNANCTSKWVRHVEHYAPDSILHTSATTLTECQKACEFDPQCIAIDWRPSYHVSKCSLNKNPGHIHSTWGNSEHYDLVSRCNITSETRCKNGLVYNSTCYKIHRNESVNWFTAVNRCLSNNGSLAVFDDHIIKYFASTLLEGPLWIGLIKSWLTWPDADEADVLYNKFDVTRWNPPLYPPYHPYPDYRCVVATSNYWRLSRCSDTHRVVCQTVGPLTTTTTTTTTIKKSTSKSSESADDTSSALTGNNTGSILSGSTLIIVVVAVVAVIVVIIVVVVFICRRRHSSQQPNHQRPSSVTSNVYQSPQPGIVYAEIEQRQDSAPANDDLYANVTPGNDHSTTGNVIYSGLQHKDAADYTVAPSGDLYTQVQKR